MHKTTREEDLLQKLLQALSKFDLPLDKLCGVATRSFVRMTISSEGAVHQISFEHRVVNIG